MLVSVDDSGAPLLSTARQSLARQVAIGQHVLVKAGESVSVNTTGCGMCCTGSCACSALAQTAEVSCVTQPQVPLDGVVVWGTANVSLQHISGESAPVRMAVGAEVPAGSVSMDGVLVVSGWQLPASCVAQESDDPQADRGSIHDCILVQTRVW
jgi:cation transport ATPase